MRFMSLLLDHLYPLPGPLPLWFHAICDLLWAGEGVLLMRVVQITKTAKANIFHTMQVCTTTQRRTPSPAHYS